MDGSAFDYGPGPMIFVLIMVPLGLVKFLEICWWLCHHIHIS